MASDPELYVLAERVGEKLKAAGRRLVTAESCTAGWVAKALTDVPGSSQWFECGYVTYSDAAKARDLGVAPRTLQSLGAVSEQTVREMAEGALRVSGVDLALAVSGIAGPDGGTPDKPVGTVWFCAAVRRPPPETREPTRRLFFALWPDAGQRAALVHATRKAVRSSGGRPVPEESLHVTLAFLGSVPERRVAELQAIARRVAEAPEAGAPIL